MKYYILALQNYRNIKGRSRRSEYWFFTIFIFLIISFILDYTTGTSFFGAGFGYIPLVYYLWIINPAFTTSVRRLNDTRSIGWLLLMGLIPLVGGI